MKTKTQLLKLSIFCLTFFALFSCNQECDCEKRSKITDASTRAVDLDINKTFRERLVSSVSTQVNSIENLPRFKFSMDMLPKGIEPKDLDILTKDITALKSEISANVEATELVTSIFNALIAAENSANHLDLEFTMSEEPIDNGSFIFGINTNDAQDLTLMMYDEEGFGMVANNEFSVEEGNNYKALNVSALEAGSYIFKLRNEKAGKELVRRVEIMK